MSIVCLMRDLYGWKVTTIVALIDCHLPYVANISGMWIWTGNLNVFVWFISTPQLSKQNWNINGVVCHGGAWNMTQLHVRRIFRSASAKLNTIFYSSQPKSAEEQNNTQFVVCSARTNSLMDTRCDGLDCVCVSKLSMTIIAVFTCSR